MDNLIEIKQVSSDPPLLQPSSPEKKDRCKWVLQKGARVGEECGRVVFGDGELCSAHSILNRNKGLEAEPAVTIKNYLPFVPPLNREDYQEPSEKEKRDQLIQTVLGANLPPKILESETPAEDIVHQIQLQKDTERLYCLRILESIIDLTKAVILRD
jgi:hypothetical protein